MAPYQPNNQPTKTSCFLVPCLLPNLRDFSSEQTLPKGKTLYPWSDHVYNDSHILLTYVGGGCYSEHLIILSSLFCLSHINDIDDIVWLKTRHSKYWNDGLTTQSQWINLWYLESYFKICISMELSLLLWDTSVAMICFAFFWYPHLWVLFFRLPINNL